MTFRGEWRSAGGMFGFMSGFGSSSGDSALIVGAGGVDMRRRIEILMARERERERMRRLGLKEMEEPKLWDARIGSDAVEEGDKVDHLEAWSVSCHSSRRVMCERKGRMIRELVEPDD